MNLERQMALTSVLACVMAGIDSNGFVSAADITVVDCAIRQANAWNLNIREQLKPILDLITGAGFTQSTPNRELANMLRQYITNTKGL